MEEDLSSHGLGKPWGHTRSYGNRVTDNAQGLNGNSWFVKQMPSLVFLDSYNPSQGRICVYGIINKALWFDYDAGSQTYKGRFGVKQTLVRDADNSQYVLMDKRGRKTVFHSEQVTGLVGKFKGFVNPAGDDTIATYDTQHRLEHFTMEYGEDKADYHYEYGESNLLAWVTYRVTKSNVETDVRRSYYYYYGSGESNGNANDLKLVIIKQFDANGVEFELNSRHYRYYKAGEDNGFQYGLKFVVGPEAYARMQADHLTPEEASDTVLAAYADNYFEYDSEKRATLERTHGGAYTYRYDYTPRSSSSSSSSLLSGGGADDYNVWKMKTVETLPDESTNTVYTNFAGQVMLKVFTAAGSSDQWCTYSRYGNEDHNLGQVILKAEPSAVAGYSESAPDLDVDLNDTTGLIHTYEYYDFTDVPGGEADDPTIYVVWKNIVYQSDADQGSEPAETTFDYLWYPVSFQMYQRTTTFPVVSVDQNGSGVAESKVEIFDDCCGRPIWTKDECGFITHSVHDEITGGLVKRIEDVNTTFCRPPELWTTPAGGGLHLVTDYTFDLLGRTTQELGPSHEVDLNGTATLIRRARWLVHHDDIDERWEGAGYATDPTLRTALGFDGQQNCVTVPNHSEFFPSQEFTVECWIRLPRRHEYWLWFMGNRPDNGQSGCMFGDASEGIGFYINNDSCIKRGDYQDGQWHHVAGVWDGSLLRCYVDGKGGEAVTCNSPPASNSNAFLIGACPTSSAFENCVMDEVRISDVARYTSDFDPYTGFEVDANTIAYYKFDEGSGETLHDATDNHFDGALTGYPKPAWVPGVASGSNSTPCLSSAAPGYVFTLINPVKITKLDKKKRVTDEIHAVRQNTSGKLVATDEFPQSSWVRWAKTNHDDNDRLTFQRVYFQIPESGPGDAGTNYNQTDYGYDSMERRNRVRTPGGTITRTVYHPCDWPLAIWVGTDDIGATDSDPSGGGGGSSNNMVKVQANEYDSGAAGGDGNLTKQTLYESTTTTRVIEFVYDFRDRRISTRIAEGQTDLFFETREYDNLDRLIQVDRWDTASKAHLIASNRTNYDNRGNAYQTIRYGMDPSSSQPPDEQPLTDSFWYDAAGNMIKQLNAGSQAFQKMVYDGVRRVFKRYTACDLEENSYTEEIVMQQMELTYDDASNLIAQVVRDRFHDATGAGDLTSPNGAQPRARVSYAAFWPDPLGRQIAVANYGTNGAAEWTRPATIPAGSDLVLVNSTEYNDRGEAITLIDPKGIVTKQEFDDAGRLTQKIENYVETA